MNVGTYKNNEGYAGDEMELETNVNIANANHLTALMVAAKFGYADVCQLLLDRGENPNLGDINEKTSLMWAVQGGQVGISHLLLNRGADPNIASDDGSTPLIIAVWIGKYMKSVNCYWMEEQIWILLTRMVGQHSGWQLILENLKYVNF